MNNAKYTKILDFLKNKIECYNCKPLLVQTDKTAEVYLLQEQNKLLNNSWTAMWSLYASHMRSSYSKKFAYSRYGNNHSNHYTKRWWIRLVTMEKQNRCFSTVNVHVHVRIVIDLSDSTDAYTHGTYHTLCIMYVMWPRYCWEGINEGGIEFSSLCCMQKV